MAVLDVRAKPKVPLKAWLWIVVVAISALGTGVMRVGLSWVAAGIGGAFAGWISAAMTFPTVLLVLFGGALGDRYGQVRVLVLTTCLSLCQYVSFLGLLSIQVPLAVLLVLNALASGTIAGLGGPSASVFIRGLVHPDAVTRAVAASSSASMITRMVAPAIGGVVLAVLSLRGALLINIVSFVGVLVFLIVFRSQTPVVSTPTSKQPMTQAVHDGLVALSRDKTMTMLLFSLFWVAGSLLTISGLGFPLLVRFRAWRIQDLGILEACYLGGSLAASTTIAALADSKRPIDIMRGGVVIATISIIGLSFFRWSVLCFILAVLLGIGTVMYTVNLSALFVALSPQEKLSRYSSVLYLTQVVPVLIFSPVIGGVAQRWGGGLMRHFGVVHAAQLSHY